MIYLASPYSHDDPKVREERFLAVCRYVANMTRAGHRVFSPIAHTHCVAVHGGLGLGWEHWDEWDKEMIRLCDGFGVLCLEGWGRSKGVKAEREYALSLNREIGYLLPTQVWR